MLAAVTIFGSIDAVAGWTLTATVVVAIATVVYVALTHRLVRAQTDPCVIVYPKFDGGSHILLVIENVGNGVARNIRFDLSREIPKYAGGPDMNSAYVKEMMTSGPLIHGIPAMKPGECRVTVWGQYGGLKKALGDEPVRVTCRFKRLPGHFASIADDDLDPVDCVLEVDSFASTLSIPNSTSGRLRALEERVDELERQMRVT